MLSLLLCWLLLGALIGALAICAGAAPHSSTPIPCRRRKNVIGAKLPPASWHHWRWLVMLIIGALAALLGGWIGALLLGKYIATAVALWVAVLACRFVPWAYTRGWLMIEMRSARPSS